MERPELNIGVGGRVTVLWRLQSKFPAAALGRIELCLFPAMIVIDFRSPCGIELRS